MKRVKTPVADFLRDYESSSAVRLHMPGHKGRREGYAHDITEICGADDLFSPSGIIMQSEGYASELFSAHTLYSTEGSSLAIRAMVHLAIAYAAECGRAPLIAAARGVHKSFVSALSLTGADVDWLCPEGSTYMSCRITADNLLRYFEAKKELPVAVYLTSPDYLGNMQNIRELSEVCHRYSVLLLVDNAHGAYLKFLSPSIHPMDLGADLCADSAHKTLPVLTGGAYLHISESAPAFIHSRAKGAMMLYASTSPSYLITESLDLANAYIADGYRERLERICLEVADIKAELEGAGYVAVGQEPMKIALKTASYGYSGSYVCEYLFKKGIVAEFADSSHIVFMPSDKTEIAELSALKEALLSLPAREPIAECESSYSLPVRARCVREAVFSPSERIGVREAVGRVFSDARLACPPAVPLIVPGEIIDEEIAELLLSYGIEAVYVLK